MDYIESFWPIKNMKSWKITFLTASYHSRLWYLIRTIDVIALGLSQLWDVSLCKSLWNTGDCLKPLDILGLEFLFPSWSLRAGVRTYMGRNKSKWEGGIIVKTNKTQEMVMFIFLAKTTTQEATSLRMWQVAALLTPGQSSPATQIFSSEISGNSILAESFNLRLLIRRPSGKPSIFYETVNCRLIGISMFTHTRCLKHEK